MRFFRNTYIEFSKDHKIGTVFASYEDINRTCEFYLEVSGDGKSIFRSD